MSWWPRLRKIKSVEEIESVNTTFPVIEKFGENLTPNMRALRLAMTAGDILLSMGVSANSVVTKGLDITEAYCQRPVHIDINANVMMLSQLRGIDKEPLTLMRPVALRQVNYMTVQSVQQLIYEIRTGSHTLEEAETELEKILQTPSKYPWWLIMFGNAGIAAGVSLMFTKSWEVILTTFVIGMTVDRILAFLASRAIPSFFRQIAAAAFVTFTAALISLLAASGVSFFADTNPTLIVVGGIIMLVAGLVIVGAIQDAIEEYYVSATARMMKVGMLTIGIVIGILIGLYTARKFGIGIAVSANPLSLNSFDFQVAGAAVAAAAYALATHTRVKAVLWAGLIGGSALVVMYSVREFGISIVPASGIAAVLIGSMGAVLSRLWRTPSTGIIAAGIVPLVPGLALYNGLMQLVNYPPGDALFARGLGTLFTALATALAIAAGASFGSMIGRPFNQKIAHNRNFVPFMDFMRKQLKASHRRSLFQFLYARDQKIEQENIVEIVHDNPENEEQSTQQ